MAIAKVVSQRNVLLQCDFIWSDEFSPPVSFHFMASNFPPSDDVINALFSARSLTSAARNCCTLGVSEVCVCVCVCVSVCVCV